MTVGETGHERDTVVAPPQPQEDDGEPRTHRQPVVYGPQRKALLAGLAALLTLALLGTGLAYASGQRGPNASVVGVGAAASRGSKLDVVGLPQGLTVTPTPVQGSAATDRAAALSAINGHWASIESKDFGKAYGFLAPTAAGSSQEAWVVSHEGAGIGSVTYMFSVAEVTGESATVDVLVLQTLAKGDQSSANPDGCINWSGVYTMTRQSGRWLISRAQISSTPC